MKPWELIHRGRMMADAMGFDPERIGELRARSRVLGAWRSGDRLLEVEGHLVLVFGEPRSLSADAGGMVLVLREGVLLSAPLREVEWEQRPSGSVLEVRGAVACAAEGQPVDPSEWLEIDLPVLAVQALAPPPVQASQAVRVVEVRRGVFGVPEMTAQAATLLEELKSPGSSSVGPAGGEASWGQSLGRGFGAFLERALGKSAEQLGLGEWIRDRHTTQLDELLSRFDGDLEQALRHAIPLGGEDGAGHHHPALRRRVPRERLSPSMAGAGSGGTLNAPPDRFEALKKAYRRSIELLVEQEEIEKAAFVHADLLGDVAAAVDLLEQHERFALAAQLAESRGLPIARTVRLLLLAGETARAFALATQHDVFAQVLQTFHGDRASTLRLRAAWAAKLVATGRLEAAVDVLWEAPRLRAGARPWLEALVERGGVPAGSALVRLAQLDPVLATLGMERLLESDLPEDVGVRAELAGAMVTAGSPHAWGRRVARQLMLDAPRAGSRSEGFGRLVLWSPLADLRADAPHLPEPAAGMGFPEHRPLSSAGALPVHDALYTPHGTLCALGESGLAFYGRDGRQRWAEGTPATHLVGEPDGFVALSLQKISGRTWRISRVDLRTGIVVPWVRTELWAFAGRSHHGRWVVAERERLLQIDLGALDWQWLWRGPNLGCRVAAIGQREGACAAVIDAKPTEAWRYDRSMILRAREEMEPEVGGPVAVGTPGWAQAMGSTVLLSVGGESRRLRFHFEVTALDFDGDRLLVAGVVDGSAWVVVLTRLGVERGRLRLDGAGAVGLRVVSGTRWGCFDDCGRVLWFDGVEVVRELRVS